MSQTDKSINVYIIFGFNQLGETVRETRGTKRREMCGKERW
jgi:hypothetical protein